MGKTALLSLSRGGADLSALTSLQTAWGLTLCEPDSCCRYTPASGVRRLASGLRLGSSDCMPDFLPTSAQYGDAAIPKRMHVHAFEAPESA